MENIKKVVKNKEWQELRASMAGTWTTTPYKNLRRLKTYVRDTTNENKLRRVHNYLGALRGVKNPDIIKMRKEIKRKRILLGYTN
jgi:hypothetical protein